MSTRSNPFLYDELTRFGLTEKRIRQHFSPRLTEISSLIGLRPTLELVEQLGGRQIYLPFQPRETTPLVQAVGMDNAVKLIDHFGHSEKIVIPNPFTRQVLLRLEGQSMLSGGASFNEVATTLRVSRVAVRNWASELAA